MCSVSDESTTQICQGRRYIWALIKSLMCKRMTLSCFIFIQVFVFRIKMSFVFPCHCHSLRANMSHLDFQNNNLHYGAIFMLSVLWFLIRRDLYSYFSYLFVWCLWNFEYQHIILCRSFVCGLAEEWWK